MIFKQSLLAKAVLSLIAFFLLTSSAKSQSKLDSIFDKLDPQKFAASIGKKAEKLEDKLVTKSMKVLDKLQSQEQKIYRKLLSTKDSLQAKVALSDIKTKYKALQDQLKSPALSGAARQLIPHLDSLTTALKFLDQNGKTGKIKDALSKTKSLQDKFQQAEEIKKFIKERREQLKQQLEKLGMVKQLKRINKQIFYYYAQIKNYREILKDHKKIENKALELLAKTKFFQDFMRKNSMFASMFGLSEDIRNSSASISLAGLQTRFQVNQLIQQQVASGGPNVQQLLQQNMQNAQGQLQVLKDKISKFGGGDGDVEMPGFKPNNQKTKSLLKRLEFGSNLQTQKATNYFPTTSDIGLSVGYKLNDKSLIGVGVSYKIGLGNGWQNIRFSSQGVGIRSFIEWKIKGNFFLSGGYEQNYKTAFSDFYQLRNKNAWQQSSLLGLGRKYKLSKKYNGKMQLLWDFMSYKQIPRTQSIIFRTGFSLK